MILGPCRCDYLEVNLLWSLSVIHWPVAISSRVKKGSMSFWAKVQCTCIRNWIIFGFHLRHSWATQVHWGTWSASTPTAQCRYLSKSSLSFYLLGNTYSPDTLIRDYLTLMSQRDNRKLILRSAWLELEGHALNKVMLNNRIFTSRSGRCNNGNSSI